VKPIQYSSLTAFLEHYKALKSSTNLSPDEISLCAWMEKLIGSIAPGIVEVDLGGRLPIPRADLGDEAGDTKRRRERDERTLRRELIAHGILTG